MSNVFINNTWAGPCSPGRRAPSTRAGRWASRRRCRWRCGTPEIYKKKKEFSLQFFGHEKVIKEMGNTFRFSARQTQLSPQRAVKLKGFQRDRLWFLKKFGKRYTDLCKIKIIYTWAFWRPIRPPAGPPRAGRREGRTSWLCFALSLSWLERPRGRTQLQVLDLPEPFIPGEISKTRSDDAVKL